jgi:hypothetical protein
MNVIPPQDTKTVCTTSGTDSNARKSAVTLEYQPAAHLDRVIQSKVHSVQSESENLVDNYG